MLYFCDVLHIPFLAIMPIMAIARAVDMIWGSPLHIDTFLEILHPMVNK
jgi:hypothetical protein